MQTLTLPRCSLHPPSDPTDLAALQADRRLAAAARKAVAVGHALNAAKAQQQLAPPSAPGGGGGGV